KVFGSKINNKKNGVWVEYEVTGKIKNYHTFQDDVLNGWFAEYDVHGTILREGLILNNDYSGLMYEYENGKLLKKRKWLFPYSLKPDSIKQKYFFESIYDLSTGMIRSEGFWRGDKKDSIWKHYDEQQSLKAIERYKEGKKTGIQERYYANGSLCERATFKENKLFGERLLLTENADTTEYGNYISNQRDGFFILIDQVSIKDLYEDVKKYRIEANYLNGYLNGKVLFKYLSGVVASEEYYLNSKLNGYRKLYFENGIQVYSCEYLNGVKSGLELAYYASGLKKSESFFLNGKLNGKQIYFYENGNKSEIFIFKDGVLEKLSRFYQNGNLMQESLYKKGVVISNQTFDESGKKILNNK
ncbi:MAG: hypothetical protein ACK452_13675, partial [Bacteroidota bacterium]